MRTCDEISEEGFLDIVELLELNLTKDTLLESLSKVFQEDFQMSSRQKTFLLGTYQGRPLVLRLKEENSGYKAELCALNPNNIFEGAQALFEISTNP